MQTLRQTAGSSPVVNFNDIDTSRSYATEDNLMTALTKIGAVGHPHRFTVVCNRAGRFTAIFAPPRDGDITKYARRGFMTIG